MIAKTLVNSQSGAYSREKFLTLLRESRLLLLRKALGHHASLELIGIRARMELLLLGSHLTLWHIAIRILSQVIGGVHGGKN